jgi:hypothetical protein
MSAFNLQQQRSKPRERVEGRRWTLRVFVQRKTLLLFSFSFYSLEKQRHAVTLATIPTEMRHPTPRIEPTTILKTRACAQTASAPSYEIANWKTNMTPKLKLWNCKTSLTATEFIQQEIHILWPLNTAERPINNHRRVCISMYPLMWRPVSLLST